MKKLNKIMLALSILPTLLTSVFLFFMNDTVPMHYNASGAVDHLSQLSLKSESSLICTELCLP